MSGRAERLVGLFAEHEVDLLLVTDLLNVRYLSGFVGTNGFVLVGAQTRILATDFRYIEQAQAQVEGFDIELLKGGFAEALTKLLPAQRPLRLGFDDTNITFRQHRHLLEALPDGVELVPAGGLVEQLRVLKSADEIAAIEAAAQLADTVFQWLAEQSFSQYTERGLVAAIESQLRARGADGTSFPPIVAAGPHGALPHAEPRDVAIPPNTLVVVDFGAKLDGYCSDCTRTYATGPLEPEAEAVYRLVLEAQLAALDALRAGVTGVAVDAAARDRIATAGHKEHFGHGLGHGVGLEVHEEPRLSPGAEDQSPLAAGSVVTVEPGVYLPGRFGVRIEDLAVVTEAGYRLLTPFTKELVTVS